MVEIVHLLEVMQRQVDVLGFSQQYTIDTSL